MAGLIALCKKYYGESDLYAVLGVPKKANEQQGRNSHIYL